MTFQFLNSDFPWRRVPMEKLVGPNEGIDVWNVPLVEGSTFEIHGVRKGAAPPYGMAVYGAARGARYRQHRAHLRHKLGADDLFGPLPASAKRGRSRARHTELLIQICTKEAKLLGVIHDLNRRLRKA